ncbi:beta-lactamase family protein [Massilia sp. Se16.2.3]|nr:serine hydrolase domain-containing protein [Massilia sp. Se16.2.3]QNB01167.1 beta-lactamase family protein [Massilia sp. Se16.2.3]
MFQKARHPALPQRPHIHALRALAQASALLAALTVFGAAPASAGTNGDIARIENGLRPVVALAGAPVVTKTLAEEMQRLHVPGVSVAVIRDGKIAWAKGFGVAYANGPAVTPKTLFQAASISKPVTALATLRMVESGELSLDADINTLLKDWKLPAADGSNATVTVRQLLSHTAGTSVSGFPGYAAGKPVPTLRQVLDGTAPANTKPVRVDSAPGADFRYSGGGYTVLQQALIDRSGRPFDALLQDSVLKPVGMGDSRFAQPLPAGRPARARRPAARPQWPGLRGWCLHLSRTGRGRPLDHAHRPGEVRTGTAARRPRQGQAPAVEGDGAHDAAPGPERLCTRTGNGRHRHHSFVRTWRQQHGLPEHAVRLYRTRRRCRGHDEWRRRRRTGAKRDPGNLRRVQMAQLPDQGTQGDRARWRPPCRAARALRDPRDRRLRHRRT